MDELINEFPTPHLYLGGHSGSGAAAVVGQGSGPGGGDAGGAAGGSFPGMAGLLGFNPNDFFSPQDLLQMTPRPELIDLNDLHVLDFSES